MIVVRLYGFGFVRDYLFLLKAKHRNSNGNVSPLPPPLTPSPHKGTRNDVPSVEYIEDAAVESDYKEPQEQS